MAPKATTEPPAADPALARVLVLLEQQTRRFDELEARSERLEAELRAAKAQPAPFTPMEPPPGVKQGGGVWGNLDSAIGGKGRRGWGEREAQGVSGQVLIDIHGEKIPERMIEQIGPRFYGGDRVRINPDATREGFPEGQTWGDVLARLAAGAKKGAKNPTGVGTVAKILWLTDEEGWKYKVDVPGVTGARPDGFHDRELLPA